MKFRKLGDNSCQLGSACRLPLHAAVQFRKLGYEMVDRICDYYTNVESSNVLPTGLQVILREARPARPGPASMCMHLPGPFTISKLLGTHCFCLLQPKRVGPVCWRHDAPRPAARVPQGPAAGRAT